MPAGKHWRPVSVQNGEQQVQDQSKWPPSQGFKLHAARKQEVISSCLKLVDNLEYLHPAEVAICNRLADLGNIYAQMSHFVCEYSTEKPICDVFLDDAKSEKQLKCKRQPLEAIFFSQKVLSFSCQMRVKSVCTCRLCVTR